MNRCNPNIQSQTQAVSQKTQRFIKYISRQLDTLKDERNTMQLAADEYISQMEIEVDKWVKRGKVNQASYAEISNVLQQSITFFSTKTEEILGLHNDETSTEEKKSSISNIQELNLPGPTAADKCNLRAEISNMTLKEKEVPNEGAVIEADDSHIITRLATLEEAVISVKKKTKHVQQNQENVGKLLDNVLTQQENVKKNITEFEKIIQDIAINADSISNIKNRLNKLDEEKEYINVKINEEHREFTCFRTITQDALISLEHLSKEVHSANENYNEMSSKINKLQVSIDLMSTQQTQMCASEYSQKQDALALDKLRDDLTSKVMDLSNQVAEINSKCCRPSVGFNAYTTFNHSQLIGLFYIQDYNTVEVNYGNHFDPKSGTFTAPISGLYLVSIAANLDDQNFIHVLRRGPCEVIVCVVMGTTTLTFCCELNGGDTIFLQLYSGKRDVAKKRVHFSCFLINGFGNGISR